MSYNKLRVSKSSKNCTCSETGKEINKGDECLIDPKDKKAYHKSSQKYQEYIDGIKPKTK